MEEGKGKVEVKEKIKFKNLDREQKKQMITMFSSLTLIFVIVLVYFCSVLFVENYTSNERWYSHLKDSPEQAARAAKLAKDAQQVEVGIYIENLRSLDMKNSEYRAGMMVWFKWKGDPELDPANNFRVYKGYENKKTVITEIHDDDINYQLVGMDVTVSKNYHTKLFPLESHQLRLYVESTYPIQEVHFKADKENSGFNEDLTITGFDFDRFAIGQLTYEYNSSHGNPHVEGKEMSSEVVTAFEIKRTDIGLFFKCFIALFATLIWLLISLYVCTYHHVNPLGMVSGALFGAVGNIVVGANLLPDGTAGGLLEYGNIWGTLVILGGVIAIISINRVRDVVSKDYAKYYGRFLFNMILAFAVIGMVLLPVFAIVR